MTARNPLHAHRAATRKLALKLSQMDVYHWLVESGYFPESYVMPPCFSVRERPSARKYFFKWTRKKYKVKRTQTVHINFPRSELTDRHFGLIDPELHNDIAYHISRNWNTIVKAMLPATGAVVPYGFPVPIDARMPGRMGQLRSGRMIYEFVGMLDHDIASMAYRHVYVVRTDIKNFYPSIYTHSIAWALHGKKKARAHINDYRLLGNRLDRLFQYANDACTNGIPVGPVVSDIIAEVIASAVDRCVSADVAKRGIDCDIVRFKDDYRIFVKSEGDGRTAIKALQRALREYNLDLNEEKTEVQELPDGLFREWVSKYHAVHPRKRWTYNWKEFRELYLAVLRIDEENPGTGVIDRFLADIVSRRRKLKVRLHSRDLRKVISMLLMLASRRAKAFPKVLAIVEAILRSPAGAGHQAEIVEYLEEYLRSLSEDEVRNRYLITWLSYFLVSNDLKRHLIIRPKYKDVVIRSVFNNRGLLFKDCKDYKLFEGAVSKGRRVSMLEHLDVFDPPEA